MGSNLRGAFGVDQRAAGDDDRLDGSQILAHLHIADAHWGIILLQMSCMAGDRYLDGKGSQRIIQCLQLIVVIRRYYIGVDRQVVDQLFAALLAQAGQFGYAGDVGGIHNTVDAVTHTDVAFYRSLCILFPQTLEGCHAGGRQTEGHRINIGGRSAQIHSDQIADAVFALASLCQQLHRCQHSRRGRHQDALYQLLCAAESLCLDNLLEEDFADLLLDRLHIRDVQSRHYVLADIGLFFLEDFLTLVRAVAVAGDDDWERIFCFGKHPCVKDDVFLVASVGTAGQQADVGIDAVDFRQISFGQLIGVGFDNLCSCAQRCLSCRFCGQLGNQTDGNHPQAAGSRGTGVLFLKLDVPDFFL